MKASLGRELQTLCLGFLTKKRENLNPHKGLCGALEVLRNGRSERSSYEEHRENALAPIADEGRDKLRKATGNSKYVLIRGCPNGETHMG